MNRLRLTVVTPVFPTSTEPHGGIYIYNAVRSLQRHADVDVVCAFQFFPASQLVRLLSARYNRAGLGFAPDRISVQYFEYPGFPNNHSPDK